MMCFLPGSPLLHRLAVSSSMAFVLVRTPLPISIISSLATSRSPPSIQMLLSEEWISLRFIIPLSKQPESLNIASIMSASRSLTLLAILHITTLLPSDTDASLVK